MNELEELFDTILNIRITPYNRDADILELGATPEEVVYLLTYLKNTVSLHLEDFVGDFPITFNYLYRYVYETSCNN